MRAVTEFPYPVIEITNTWVPLADGTRLAARIWMPEDAVARPVPAVLEYIPYRKREFTAARDALVHPYVAGHGYACVRVDIRGSGESDGVLTDEYLKLEQDDALEVIAWLERQSWCTGSIGMMGNSWGGFNALQVAARRPPALLAIITSCASDDRYADDIHYMGGCLLNNNLGWSSSMFAHNSRPPDPALVGDSWRAMWMHRLEGSGLWIDTWLRHQRRDALWKHGSVCEDFGAITCPVFAVGGWNDAYTNAIPRLLSSLKVPRMAWIGPWAHRFPHMAAPGPAVGFLQEAVRWWDHWLKKRDTGLMEGPMLRAYIQDYVPPLPRLETIKGRWVAERTWPGPGIQQRRMYLNHDGLQAAGGSETRLTISSPQDVGLFAGCWCGHGIGPTLPTDQRAEDAGSLVFESAPLEYCMDLLGAPVVQLELEADRPQAMVAVRLNDVAPDGAVTRVSYGLLNLTHRDSHEFPKPLVPGQRYRVRVQLNDVGQAFLPGHRIRIAISTSYWPIAWPSPESVTLTLYAGVSVLELPVRQPNPDQDRTAAPPPAEQPEGLRVTTLIAGGEDRRVTHDIGRQESVVESVNDQGTLRYDDIDLTTRVRSTERYVIKPSDPLSARTEIAWTVAMSRGDWAIETRTRTVMTSTRTSFHLQAELDAFEGSRRVFSRNWTSEIPRDEV